MHGRSITNIVENGRREPLESLTATALSLALRSVERVKRNHNVQEKDNVVDGVECLISVGVQVTGRCEWMSCVAIVGRCVVVV